jgi:hypothetical protein
MVILVIDPVSRKRERGFVFSVSPKTKALPYKKEFLTGRRHTMKISARMMKGIVVLIGVSLFLGAADGICARRFLRDPSGCE